MQFAGKSFGRRVATRLSRHSRMGTGSSKVKEVRPVSEWSYSGTPDIDNNDNHEIGAIYDSISGRPFLLRSDTPKNEASSSGEEEEVEEPLNDVQKPQPRFHVPLYIQPSTPQKSLPDDLQELQDLSRTLDSLGIPETKIDSSEERWIGVRDDASAVGMVQRSAGALSSLGDEPNFSAGSRVSVGPSVHEGSTSYSRQDAGLRSGPGFTGAKLGGSFSARSHSGPPPQPRRDAQKVNLKAVSAPTNFIWSPPEDELKAAAASDEWIYAKKEVDGFDLDKFRTENSNARHHHELASRIKKRYRTRRGRFPEQGNGGVSSRSKLAILFQGVSHAVPRNFSSTLKRVSIPATHPHSVPEYDSTDEQIFGNIEQEFAHH